MIIFMRKRIKLVIVLFKEAGKAAAHMPLLLFEPILVNKCFYLFSSHFNETTILYSHSFVDFCCDSNYDCAMAIFSDLD